MKIHVEPPKLHTANHAYPKDYPRAKTDPGETFTTTIVGAQYFGH
jgi:hypothetical protein